MGHPRVICYLYGLSVAANVGPSLVLPEHMPVAGVIFHGPPFMGLPRFPFFDLGPATQVTM